MNITPLAALYQIDPSSLRLLTTGFHNRVYEWEQAGKKHILRAVSCSRRDLQSVQGELDWVQFLGQHDIPVALPIPNVDGQLATEVELNDGERVIVSAFEYAPGGPVDVQDPAVWNATLFQKWGEVIGRIHAVSKGYMPSDPALRRPDWSVEIPKVQEIQRHFAEKDAEIAAKCEQWLAKIAALPVTEDTYGLTHNDFHQGNLHVQDGQITVFDFDDGLYGWFANDIAVAFYHAYWHATWSQPDIRRFAEEYMQNFLAGYSRVNTLRHETVAQIPLFLKWREVFLLHLFETSWDLERLEGWQAGKLQELRDSLLRDTPYSHLDFERLL